MTVWEELSHQVAISGKVTGPVSGQGLGHVRVSIVDAPDEYLEWLAVKRCRAGDSWFTTASRPDRVITQADGHFQYMDLPDGDYILHAAFPNKSTRYGGVQHSVTVSRTTGDTNVIAQANIVLPATSITGTVTRQGSGTPVPMAKVMLIGSGESAVTDEQGKYLLAGIEASRTQNRVVSVDAHGYKNQTLPVSVTASGMTVTQNIILEPS